VWLEGRLLPLYL
jgi:hypothetical protein